MPYVRTVPYRTAEGDTREAYDTIMKARGSVPNVHAVSALRPHTMKSFALHVGVVLGSESGLTPAEKEMIATVVSAINKCAY